MPRTTSRQPRPAAPPPVESIPETSAPAAGSGRETNGRFAKGNKGGPGNPFARQVAALRKQLVEAVTPEVMAQICTVLILRAQGGNLAAIKLLFGYVLGKPAEAVNPDTLDHEEMQLYGRDIGMDELMGKVLLSVPAELACECVRGARPDILDRVVEAAARQGCEGHPLGGVDEMGRGRPAPPAPVLDQEPPGDDLPAGEAPMTNGGDGESEAIAEAGRGEEAPTAKGRIRPAPQARPGHTDNRSPYPTRTGSDGPVSANARRTPPSPSGGQAQGPPARPG